MKLRSSRLKSINLGQIKVPLELRTKKKHFNILGTLGHWPWKLHRAGDFNKNTQKQSIENDISSRRTQDLITHSSSPLPKSSFKHDSKMSETYYKPNKKDYVNNKYFQCPSSNV